LLGVFEVGGVGGIVAGFAEGLGDAVLDEEAGHAEGVEPVAGVEAFAIPGEDLVATSGKDEGGAAGVVVAGRVDGEGGDGDVGEAGGAVAVDEVVGGLGDVGLGGGGLGGLGRGVRPEGKGLRGRRGLRGGDERRGDEGEGGKKSEGTKSHAEHSMPNGCSVRIVESL